MVDNKLVNASIIFMGIFIFFFVLKYFAVFLIPFTFATMITFFLAGIVKFANKKKIPTWVAFGILSLLLGI